MLRACVPSLTNEHVDSDVSDALAACVAAATVEYGSIFDGSTRTVYNKLMSARKRGASL